MLEYINRYYFRTELDLDYNYYHIEKGQLYFNCLPYWRGRLIIALRYEVHYGKYQLFALGFNGNEYRVVNRRDFKLVGRSVYRVKGYKLKERLHLHYLITDARVPTWRRVPSNM